MAPHGRRTVTLVALAVVVVAVSTALLAGTGESRDGGSASDPSATLDAALADGTPAYVLIHSLT